MLNGLRTYLGAKHNIILTNDSHDGIAKLDQYRNTIDYLCTHHLMKEPTGIDLILKLKRENSKIYNTGAISLDAKIIGKEAILRALEYEKIDATKVKIYAPIETEAGYKLNIAQYLKDIDNFFNSLKEAKQQSF
jgi:hypothetical protein